MFIVLLVLFNFNYGAGNVFKRPEDCYFSVMFSFLTQLKQGGKEVGKIKEGGVGETSFQNTRRTGRGEIKIHFIEWGRMEKMEDSLGKKGMGERICGREKKDSFGKK